MINIKFGELGLRIDAPFITPDALNFRPDSWPPAPDFPVIIDAEGNIVSRYGDSVWHLWPWSKRNQTINFGDGPQRKLSSHISRENSNILRQIAAWWLYGPRSVQAPSTLMKQIVQIKPIFVHCSKAGINVADIHRFPAVLDEFIDSPEASLSPSLPFHLHTLYEWHEELGFIIFPPEGIKRIAIRAKSFPGKQTAYIPPRIWNYQVNRLREFLEDFTKNKENIEECYRFYLEIYKDVGSPPRPSRSKVKYSHELKPFATYAEEFGIHGLLTKWLGDLTGTGRGLGYLTSYITLTGYVGTAYILNFSMMRIDEAWRLRRNCLEIEEDDNFGKIYLLKGETTKTIDDDDARWVTSPSVNLAIEAMNSATSLRLEAAAANPVFTPNKEELENPWLALSRCEPWSAKCSRPDLSTRHNYPSYASIIKDYKNLFSTTETTITEEDLALARQITSNLDEQKYAAGRTWNFTWHQLRRTGAVNMMASSLVSDSSIQYQLKHASRAMSLYYGKGYSRARLNSSARSEYIATMYEVLARDVELLTSQNFISPHGDYQKSRILSEINILTTKQIEAAIKKGAMSWRPTIFGGCTKSGACPHGGVDNLARCGGSDGLSPCADMLIDKRNEERLLTLRKKLQVRLNIAIPDSPLANALATQAQSIDNVLNIIARS